MRVIFIAAIASAAIVLTAASPSFSWPAHTAFKSLDRQHEERALPIYQIGFNYGARGGYWSTYNIMNRCYGCGRRGR
jgi:hypothetical protein